MKAYYAHLKNDDDAGGETIFANTVREAKKKAVGCEEGLVLPDFIDVVISLYPWEKYILNPNQIRVEQKMYDSVDQQFEQVDKVAYQVNRYLDAGKTVLVHCQAGLNRSSLIVARSLMLKGMTADEAITLLREKRSPACLCNPSFEKYLRSF